ncbi:MAG: hypothetical protein ABDH20_07945 [Thermus sp.]
MKKYAGGGKRALPPEGREAVIKVAMALVRRGWTLRTGGAEGADEAFLLGAKRLHGGVEIYLPWKGYRGLQGPVGVTPYTLKVASAHHEGWDRLSRGVQALHARNVAVLLGPNGEDPVSFLVIWAPKEDGGSGHAIRVARGAGLPVFNLAHLGGLEALRAWIISREGP